MRGDCVSTEHDRVQPSGDCVSMEHDRVQPSGDCVSMEHDRVQPSGDCVSMEHDRVQESMSQCHRDPHKPHIDWSGFEHGLSHGTAWHARIPEVHVVCCDTVRFRQYCR